MKTRTQSVVSSTKQHIKVDKFFPQPGGRLKAPKRRSELLLHVRLYRAASFGTFVLAPNIRVIAGKVDLQCSRKTFAEPTAPAIDVGVAVLVLQFLSWAFRVTVAGLSPRFAMLSGRILCRDISGFGSIGEDVVAV